MQDTDEKNHAQDIVNHFGFLLNSPQMPDLPGHLAHYEQLQELDALVRTLREVIFAFSVGSVLHPVEARGFSAGCLKALQAKLSHLVWQVKQVEAGDFSHTVDFMEDFSSAFNAMVGQLRTSIEQLRYKEEALLKLTGELQEEVTLRNEAMKALAESEANFRYMAEHDVLTGCLNRRVFFSRAVLCIQEARQRTMPCCIALVDIDFFKKVNDVHGHLAGDVVIRSVVTVVRSGLRETDFVGRYGGEEFILFFPETTLDQAAQVCERIRANIAASPTDIGSGQMLAVTVSLGVSVVLPEWEEERNISFLQKIIHQADLALYAAKSAGRNRVRRGDMAFFQ